MLKVNGRRLERELDQLLLCNTYIAYWDHENKLSLSTVVHLTEEEQRQLVDFIQAGPPKKLVYVTGRHRIHEDGTDPEVYSRHANRWYNDREDALWVKAYQMGLVIGRLQG